MMLEPGGGGYPGQLQIGGQFDMIGEGQCDRQSKRSACLSTPHIVPESRAKINVDGREERNRFTSGRSGNTN